MPSLFTTASILRSALVTAVLLVSHAAQAVDAPLFAAPAANHASGPAGGGSIGQVTIALGVVLAFVFVAAWALRHLRKINLSGQAQHLEVVAQVSLGAKERAVLIRVNNLQVLVGVAPGHVTALHTFTTPVEIGVVAEKNVVPTTTPAAMPSFQALLKKSLGLSK